MIKKNLKYFLAMFTKSFDYRKNNIEFYTTPSTCYQFKKQSEDFALEDNISYGYRVIDITR
jgi:Icc protein